MWCSPACRSRSTCWSRELQSLGLSVELLHEDEEQPMLAEPTDELTVDSEVLSEMDAMEWMMDVDAESEDRVGLDVSFLTDDNEDEDISPSEDVNGSNDTEELENAPEHGI